MYKTVSVKATAPGKFGVANPLGKLPTCVVIQPTSGGCIWFQLLKYDKAKIYLVASDAGVTADLVLW